MSVAPPAHAPAASSGRLADELRLLAEVIASDDPGPFHVRVQRALQVTSDLLGYEVGILSRIDGDTYTVVSSHAPEADLAPGTEFHLGDTYCSITLDHDDLLEIDHVERSPHRAHPCYQQLALESYVGIPVRLGDDVWGTLNFSSAAPRTDRLADADRDTIRLLAVWIGGVLERDQRERAAAEHDARLRTIVDHAPVVLFGTDAAGRFTFSEGAGLTALGLAPGEVVGSSVFELYADHESVMTAVRAVLAGESATWHTTLGDRHYVSQASPTRDPRGAVTGMIGVSLDLTEQRRAEAAAKAHLERFRTVAESAVDGIVITDAGGTITGWNASATRIFGYASKAALGKPITLILPDHLQTASGVGMLRVISGERPHVVGRTVRLEGRRASGESFPVDVSLTSWGVGPEAEFAAILRDVTEHVEHQQELQESEERFRALSDATFEGIAFTEAGRIIDCNEQLAWLFGYARVEDMIGTSAADLCAPEYVDKVRTMTVENRPGSYEAVCIRRDGSRFWAEVQGRPAPLDGRTVRVTAIRDVTVRKRMEEQRRFQADVLAHVSDAVVALDLDGRITYWNAGAEALHGQSANDVLGRRLEDVVTYLVPDLLDDPRAEGVTAEAALQSAAAEAGELVYVAPDGSRRFVSVSSSVLRTEDGAERGLLAVARDVTSQRRMAARLKHQALHDVLTGLPNRALFRQRIETALDHDTPFAVLFVDLDHFKVVNDSLGHDAGDRLLETVARRIRGVLGAYEGSMVARLGGDEFGVFVPTAESDPEAAGQAVLDALGEPVDLGGRPVAPSASVGLVPEAERYDTTEGLLRDADTAMYAAKHGGRRRLTVFDTAMHEAANRRFGLEQDLRSAIANEELRVHFQPIVDLEDGKIVGFEARVRWDHPGEGLLSSHEFLPLAEEIGLDIEIDRWVLEAACRSSGAWIAEAGLFLSVHCSGRTFLTLDLAERARAAAEAAGLHPASLVLELAENSLTDSDEARRAVAGLRRNGLRIEVDNFGAGASSLRLLHALPVDGLKIDQTFVADLVHSDSALAIARAVVGLAADLDLQAIADGVETLHQLRDLRALGAHYAQGYLFSKPVPPEEARTMLRFPPWADAWASWTRS